MISLSGSAYFLVDVYMQLYFLVVYLGSVYIPLVVNIHSFWQRKFCV